MKVCGARKSGPRWLFVGKRFYTNKDALEERFGRIYQLPLHWARDGNDVRLWLIDYHTREKRRIYDEGLEVSAAPLLSLRSVVLFFGVLFRLRPQVIVASGDCYIGFLGWLMARICGSRFVFDIYDKYDEFGGYIRPLGRDLFGFLRRQAKHRLYAAASLAEYFGDTSADQSSIIPNGVDHRKFHAMDQDECRDRLELDRSVQFVGYFGSLETDRGVEDLLDAVERIRVHNHKLHLVICGKLHVGLNLERAGVVYCGMVPHWQIPFYLNACDVLAIPYRRSLLVDTSSSCKIAEYLCCKRPIVSTSTPNFVRNFPGLAAALGPAICRPGDVADLARALEYQLDNAVVLKSGSDISWSDIAQRAHQAIRSGIEDDRR